jgi:hypothetical protein
LACIKKKWLCSCFKQKQNFKTKSTFYDVLLLRFKNGPNSKMVSILDILELENDALQNKKFIFEENNKQTYFELKLTTYTYQGKNSTIVQLKDVTANFFFN